MDINRTDSINLLKAYNEAGRLSTLDNADGSVELVVNLGEGSNFSGTSFLDKFFQAALRNIGAGTFFSKGDSEITVSLDSDMLKTLEEEVGFKPTSPLLEKKSHPRISGRGVDGAIAPVGGA